MRMGLVALCAVAAFLGTASFAAGAVCSYNMQAFSEGTTSCQNGRQFRCSGGKWESVGTDCADAGKSSDGAESRQTRSKCHHKPSRAMVFRHFSPPALPLGDNPSSGRVLSYA